MGPGGFVRRVRMTYSWGWTCVRVRGFDDAAGIGVRTVVCVRGLRF